MDSPKYTQIQDNLQRALREIESAIWTIEDREDCEEMLQGLLSIREEIDHVFDLALDYDDRVAEEIYMQDVEEEEKDSEGNQ